MLWIQTLNIYDKWEFKQIIIIIISIELNHIISEIEFNLPVNSIFVFRIRINKKLIHCKADDQQRTDGRTG